MSAQDMRRFNLKWAEDADGCRLWTGALNPRYGNFYADGKIWKAHRWIFREQFGYLPPVVMHRCDKPSCVNWEGCLAPGTHWENMRDMAAKGRAANQMGAANANSRLTEADVIDIHIQVAAGKSGRLIAEQFGVSRSLIKRIASGASWSHLIPEQRDCPVCCSPTLIKIYSPAKTICAAPGCEFELFNIRKESVA